MRALLHETRRAPDGILRRALSALRKVRLLAGDPTVVVMVADRELVLPLSHDLPVHQARHGNYSLNLGRVAAALDEARPGASIVDIGANVGDSVAIIRHQCNRRADPVHRGRRPLLALPAPQRAP